MMLNAFLPKIEQRYAFAGSAIGILFPVFCFSVDVLVHGWQSFWTWACQSPDQATLATLPIWMGLVFLQIGRSRSRMFAQMALTRAKEIQLIHNALYDRLTGLPNRLALENDLEALFANAKPLTLLLIDLNKFKYVNDTMGHDAGDELLMQLGHRLGPALGHRGRMYRLGGDEFVVIMDGHIPVPEVDAICKALENLSSQPFELKNGVALTGASIGISLSQTEDRSMTTILKRADIALYKAKQFSGGAHIYFKPEMATESLIRMELERDLQRGLREGEFFLKYQPIVGVESRVVRSLEALLRWNHPTKGEVQPDDFIPIAERTGLISPIGNWVVHQACTEAAGWPAPTGVAVNVSGDQFKDAGFVDFVAACLSDTGLAPGRLTIEVTESIFSVDRDVIRDSLVRLRSLGVRIALDDFGMGFSSISNLRHFPLDHLKVDRSFTRAMLDDHRDAELMDIMMRLGATFNVSTTIEGIETEGQMDFVRTLGAAEAQGFLFSRPLHASEVLELLARGVDIPSGWAGRISA